jgi:hypothetical protein
LIQYETTFRGQIIEPEAHAYAGMACLHGRIALNRLIARPQPVRYNRPRRKWKYGGDVTTSQAGVGGGSAGRKTARGFPDLNFQTDHVTLMLAAIHF